MTYNKDNNIAYIKANVPKDRLKQFESEIRADERIKMLDLIDTIKTLAKSEDTILSDKQYYTLMSIKGAEMTNREKLFKVLEEMDNKKLSETIDLFCSDCPAKDYCIEHDGDENTCQNTIYAWFNK